MATRKITKKMEVTIYDCERCGKETLDYKKTRYYKTKTYCLPCFEIIKSNNQAENLIKEKDDCPISNAIEYANQNLIERILNQDVDTIVLNGNKQNQKYSIFESEYKKNPYLKENLESLFKDFANSINQLKTKFICAHSKRYRRILSTIEETIDDTKKRITQMQEKINNSYQKISVPRRDGKTIDDYYLLNPKNEFWNIDDKK